jgi:hypothetical protein
MCAVGYLYGCYISRLLHWLILMKNYVILCNLLNKYSHFEGNHESVQNLVTRLS